MPYDAPPELASLSLEAVARAVADRKLPLLEHWHPSQTIDSGMRIDRDGQWFHQGRQIARPAMVRAFASLLMQDDQGAHWLMTPQCRQSIEVEDAAFIAVDVERKGAALVFRLNTDELVIAGPGHLLRAAGSAAEPAVYLTVRHGCEARINRSTWLQLAELADDAATLTSNGARFALTPA